MRLHDNDKFYALIHFVYPHGLHSQGEEKCWVTEKAKHIAIQHNAHKSIFKLTTNTIEVASLIDNEDIILLDSRLS